MTSPRPVRVVRRTCRVALPLALALALAPVGDALAQTAPSLIQRLRGLLGIQRPLAVAGSRSPGFGWFMPPAGGGAAPSPASTAPEAGLFCVFSPWTAKALGDGTYTAVTRSGAPPIAASSPLADLQILRDGLLIHRQRATSTQPIATPLAWPIEPLRPGEQLELRLQPLGLSGSLRLRLLREPLPAGLDPQALARAGEMEQVLADLLRADPAQRNQAVTLLGRSCKAPA